MALNENNIMCLNLKRAVAAHQVVQINAITVRVICATARRYNSTRTHTQIPTTTKKMNQFSLSNSHLLMRSGKVEVPAVGKTVRLLSDT